MIGKKLKTAVFCVGLTLGGAVGGYFVNDYVNISDVPLVNKIVNRPDMEYSDKNISITYTIKDKSIIENYGRKDFETVIKAKGQLMYDDFRNPHLKKQLLNIDVAAESAKAIIIWKSKQQKNLEERLPKDEESI